MMKFCKKLFYRLGHVWTLLFALLLWGGIMQALPGATTERAPLLVLDNSATGEAHLLHSDTATDRN